MRSLIVFVVATVATFTAMQFADRISPTQAPQEDDAIPAPHQLEKQEQVSSLPKTKAASTRSKSHPFNPKNPKADDPHARLKDFLRNSADSVELDAFASQVSLLAEEVKANPTLKNKPRYEESIQLARTLLAQNTETPTAAGKVKQRSLLAYLSAYPMNAHLSDLDDVLSSAASDAESAKNFLSNVKSLRWELPTSIHTSKATCQWLARSLIGQNAEGTWEQQDKLLDEALAHEGANEGSTSRMKKTLLASIDLNISGKADIEKLPASWRSTQADSTLRKLRGQGSEPFFQTARELADYLSPTEMIKAAQHNKLAQDVVFGPEMAAIIPPDSLDIRGLMSFDMGAEQARFAIENPRLLKDGDKGITSYFSVWTQIAPMEASAFLITLPDSREKYFAAKGLVDRISKSDPISAELWKSELNRLKP